MGKQFGGNNNRGRGAPRGGGGRGGPRGGGNRGGRSFDQGPPSFVVPYGVFLHRSENCFVIKCTDLTRVPKFNRAVYLESKAKVGSVDEILGPVSGFYFSVKPAEGIKADSFDKDQVFYMNPEDLLGIDRFTKKQAPGPKGPRPAGGKQFGAKPFGKPPGGFPQKFQSGGKPGGFNKGGNFGGSTKPIYKK